MKEIDIHYADEVKLARQNNKEMQKIFTGLASGDSSQIERVDTILKGKVDLKSPIPTNAQRAARRPNHLAIAEDLPAGAVVRAKEDGTAGKKKALGKTKAVGKTKAGTENNPAQPLLSGDGSPGGRDGTGAIIFITAASAAGAAAFLTAAFMGSRSSR
eukprot:CAMPEP_0194284742 /NCGR_PEP_ID=MMETSP0169-20130528/28456_1 /TAXON_ID=218684 /ORGANISM="Corethron pennatum, Strain L29A3" /LENGTH=157 /DNA_ID=CAMNT_0039030655 /DNA_START=101 /DNA_END=574 /DNA_ORIENTATION=-